MADLLGKCGCNCGKCLAYIGNAKSEEDRAKCSEVWKKYLNIGIKAEKCVCFGCQAKEPWKTGNMLPDRSCIVKRCAEKSNLKTCAHCYSFPCDFLKERSKNDYNRKWVENRVGGKISEEEYEDYVQPFETFKNITRLREALKEDDICAQPKVESLKIKVSDFPKAIKGNEESGRVLKNTYDFLVDLRQCKSETYIQQTIYEKRMKPAFVILWVFALYGKFVDDDYSKLVISSDLSAEKPEFRSMIRKRDNFWHGSVEQVSFM